ncbi:hypothetical protein [Streptosporangium vulgare]|uniref:Uncharacterized protein n=1 Tax=Streptosporangium vulgare TaxID=46190 RepID=A0ABV5TUP4_9ACTN
MSWFLPFLGFCLLLALGSHVSDWLEDRAKAGRKAIKDVARYEALVADLEADAREFRDIDNFADITDRKIADFRNPKKEISS